MLKRGPPTWRHLPFWRHGYLKVQDKIKERIEAGATIFPRPNQVFAALQTTPFDKVKVVILAQDPYHTKGLAHGYAFSVLPHIKKLPPSLLNILKEHETDLGYKRPKTGDLRPWAERGVLLLNTCLTVEEGKPNSHEGIGWEMLTFDAIRALDEREGVVFNLWGRQAQEYLGAIRRSPAVCVSHPSGLSAHLGFRGSKVFSKTNEKLKEIGVTPIDWKLV